MRRKLKKISIPKIWIEAVAPSAGQDNLPDSVPPVNYAQMPEYPSEQIILRYRTAIREKYDNKYYHYRKDGIRSAQIEYDKKENIFISISCINDWLCKQYPA